jgi:hypothetical protein
MFCKKIPFFITKVIVPLAVGIVLATARKRMKMHSDRYSQVYNLLKFRYFQYIFQINKKCYISNSMDSQRIAPNFSYLMFLL